MDRREALKRVGLMMGGTVSMSTVAGVLGGCRASPTTVPYVFQTLVAGQDELVATLAELIIPETDTPGARAAGVHEFIDLMLTEWFPPRERDHFLAGLADLETRAQAAYGRLFTEATPEEQAALLTEFEADSLAHEEELEGAMTEFGERVRTPALTAQDPDLEEPPLDTPFFDQIKEMTLAGYYTSEVGATVELRDMPFGGYVAHVPFEEVGRAWS